MTDIRRTMLWVVFTMSLVLLWDAWQQHTGQPTLFGGPAQNPQQRDKLLRALDAIKDRHGDDAVHHASKQEGTTVI